MIDSSLLAKKITAPFQRIENGTGVQNTEVIAMDGGGTKTLLLRVRRDATIADCRKAGGSNPFNVPGWRSVISGLMVGQQERLASAAFGLAGFGESARISMELSETVSVLCPAPHCIHNDVDMACRGAFLNEPGILLLSGTGSMGWGLGTNGQTVRVGGWGSLFGDEGSAYWIGRMALIRLAHCLDGRETAGNDYVSRIAFLQGWPDDKALCTAALQDWYASLDDVRPKVAALAVGIGRLAEQGCVVAREIFEQAAALLAAHVHALRRSLGEPHLRWSYAGGTMQSVVLREALTRECGAPQPPGLPPIGGAVLVAAERAGWSVDATFVARLAESLKAARLV